MSSVDGSGSTLTFSGFTAELTGINFSGMERAVLESTNLSTTDAKEYIAAKLYDAGEVSVEFNVNDDQTGALAAYPALEHHKQYHSLSLTMQARPSHLQEQLFVPAWTP